MLLGLIDNRDLKQRGGQVGKILIVLGTRPEIIKFTPIIHECERLNPAESSREQVS